MLIYFGITYHVNCFVAFGHWKPDNTFLIFLKTALSSLAFLSPGPKVSLHWLGVATRGKGGSLPPPQPPIGNPLRSIQILGYFVVGKNGGMLPALRQI